MRNFISLRVASAFSLCLVATTFAQAQSRTIFQIGKRDRSFMEFSATRAGQRPVVFRVGESSEAKDWDAQQPGSFDTDFIKSYYVDDVRKHPEGVPFQVVFSLPSGPKGKFVLHLDAIFRYRSRPAAPWYEVDINGHRGRYRLSPEPAPELWWPLGSSEGQRAYTGYESLDMPLPAAYFRPGSNTLTVRCVDGFGLDYDDLSLSNEPGGGPPLVISGSVEPTIFYKRHGADLVELIQARIRTSRPLGRARIKVSVGSSTLEKEVEQNEFGDVIATLEVTAAEGARPAALFISGSQAPIFRGTFQPARRWRVYAMSSEQTDFGFDEVPARTSIWENRYTDKFLEIMKEFPSYSFTLDTSFNLETYLRNRDETQQKLLLDYLRSGKVGINALYMNYFTGLATAEEHFRVLEYALRAASKYGFPLDSASQTDEPSVTGSFPQVLSAAGIKYFANGSDPIRAPFNPIGHLNFKSPFYWEGPNGAKVLMWSAVSYYNVGDLTWGGWNPDDERAGTYSPSLFGLEHSLPLFLSQYNRPDYPLDAVLLYGLLGDAIPIRHFGSADIMARWNQEFAYPQVIPASQRDFFTYVTGHFGSQLKTYKGDGGAYWEDEAGADARVAAMNRTSQTQILVAEKFESIANWLKPLLRFDEAPFLAAWNNIMLTDCYVWSDAHSHSRPYSHRTQFGEATHRAWAAAGLQQSWDLGVGAMDKIAELIHTDNPGAVVFNSESWPQDGYFDFELDPGETLQYPATKEVIPCGSLRTLDGYQDVRCWASQVPALGYKFYSIEKGKVPEGESVALAGPDASVEGRYYRLQLDPHSGAIAHLVDKDTGKELVNSQAGYLMNEYLYVSGGGGRLVSGDATDPVPELTINRPTLAATPQVRQYPWGTVITIRARATNTPQIVTTITLSQMRKLVTIRNEVEKTSTLKKEGVYFAYPFAVQRPQVLYQGATAWVNPETEMLPGANRQWFTTQGGVLVKGQDESVGWVTVDAPLITLEDINRGLWSASIEIRQGTVFSYAMNNYWFTDTPAQQGGNFTFRYALTSGPNLSLLDVTRMAAEQRAELPTIRHYHKQWQQTLPETGAGFLSTSPAGVNIVTIRPGVDPDTYLIRVHNTAPQEVQAKLQFPRLDLSEVYLGSVVGERVGSVDWSAHEISVPMARYDIKTLVVRLKNPQE